MKAKIQAIFDESNNVKRNFVNANAERIEKVARLIASAFTDGRKLLIFGNGGSSTDASHIAAEFVGRYQLERPGLPAVCLNTDMAIITAVSNDYDFSEVFARQIKALGAEGDVAVGITTSGTSQNIVKAFDAAHRKGLITVAFTGARGKGLASSVDHAFVVPSAVTARIQEAHITLGHVLCQLVEEVLFEAPRKR